MLNKFLSIIILLFYSLCYADGFILRDSKNASLPEGFVYLCDIDPTIIIEMKYFYEDNFLGCQVRGYTKPQAILTIEAANALKKVQTHLRSKGYSLVVYDAYRPQKAVEHFINWAEDLTDQRTKSKFYPNISKAELINLGYINEKSTHSRGSSVDVTIIPTDRELRRINEIKRVFSDGSEILFLDDGTVDMGSSYNLFDEVSAHNCPKNTTLGDINRKILKSAMQKHGFIANEKEWWHYTLAQEPFPDSTFNFDVE